MHIGQESDNVRRPHVPHSCSSRLSSNVGWCKTRQAPWLNRVAIEKINNLTRQENIKMVFITGMQHLTRFQLSVSGGNPCVVLRVRAGDITNSAMPEQWAKAKEVLSHLKVPYLPVFGNHDIWSYNSTYEEPYPTGTSYLPLRFPPRVCVCGGVRVRPG